MALERDSQGVFKIGASVGEDAENNPADVSIIQQLLNQTAGASPVTVDGVCGPGTIAAIEAFQSDRLGFQNPDGRVDPGGRTMRALSGLPPKDSGPAPAKLYTDNPNERPVTRTTPTARQVADLLLADWPGLVEQGARTLTAQFMIETGSGRFCYNWNLGNVKSAASNPHMYLANVWECMESDAARKAIASGGGKARLAGNAEIVKRGWLCDNTVVVFDPPHTQSRFRAYATLAEGAVQWVGKHRNYAASVADYLSAINAGNVDRVAQVLKQKKYYTAPEASYASQMRKLKAQIDASLGPIG